MFALGPVDVKTGRRMGGGSDGNSEAVVWSKLGFWGGLALWPIDVEIWKWVGGESDGNREAVVWPKLGFRGKFTLWSGLGLSGC